jgi:hypothetical protein
VDHEVADAPLYDLFEASGTGRDDPRGGSKSIDDDAAPDACARAYRERVRARDLDLRPHEGSASVVVHVDLEGVRDAQVEGDGARTRLEHEL